LHEAIDVKRITQQNEAIQSPVNSLLIMMIGRNKLACSVDQHIY